MRLDELDFDFPRDLIAQDPVEPRDSCRLMYLPAGGERRHCRFWDLPSLLRPGDTLVFNDSRVLPARVVAHKPTGGRVEVLFLRPASVGNADPDLTLARSWEILARPSHSLKVGGTVLLDGGEELGLLANLGEGRWVVTARGDVSPVRLMQTYGRMPLPPYIKKYPCDPESYQTVYGTQLGSAAAPTAGLHFTSGLLRSLEARGIDSTSVTLHVGLDTFYPIRETIVENHRIHREAYSVSAQSLDTLRATRERGRRVVAVGTTATRVLETIAQAGVLDGSSGPAVDDAPWAEGQDGGVQGSTGIFITPGYCFRATDAMLTNFHLPHSSVLALVMALAGKKRLLEAYRDAIACRYRFFSFGDAMLVEKPAPTFHDALRDER